MLLPQRLTGRMLLLEFTLLLALLISGSSAHAQSPELDAGQTNQLSRETGRATADFGLTRIPKRTRPLELFGVTSGGHLSLAYLELRGRLAQIVLPDQSAIPLPLRLPVKLATNGKTVLQFGDALEAMHPARTDLFWIAQDGKISAEVRNRFAGNTLITLSEDGFTLAGGPEYFGTLGSDGEKTEPRDSATAPMQIEVYSPEGKALWRADIDRGRRIDELFLQPGGSGAAALTANLRDPIGDRSIDIFERGAFRERVVPKIGTVQRATLVGEKGHLLVQGDKGHALVSISEAEILWQRPGAIRLVGTQAAALDSALPVLYMMTGQRTTKAKSQGLPLYDWVLTALDLESGKPLGQLRIDEPLAATLGPIFLQAREGQLDILAGSEVLNFRFRL